MAESVTPQHIVDLERAIPLDIVVYGQISGCLPAGIDGFSPRRS